jgi:hypothetical protein
MALIYELKTTWSDPVVLAQDEIWQARYGSVFITTSDTPEDDDGLALVQNDGIRLRAGLQVRYRKEGGTGALIAREIV